MARPKKYTRKSRQNVGFVLKWFWIAAIAFGILGAIAAIIVL